jgi:hypothetical protein
VTGYQYLKASIKNAGDACIVWKRGKSGSYGSVYVNGKDRRAHAVALELTTPRPDGKVCSIRGNRVPGDKLEAAHGPCHNPLCYNPKHLSWKTRAENADDMKRDGTHQAGESHSTSTIPQWEVDAMRAEWKGPQNRWSKTGPTLRELADKYGCSHAQVHDILHGKYRSVA